MFLALGALAPGARLLSQEPDTTALALNAVRYFRAANTTLVDVFGRIPLRVLTPLPAPGGGRGAAAYRVAITVRDSSNLTLVSQSWSQAVPAGLLALPGGSTAEHATFAAQ